QKALKYRRVKHYGYEFRYDNNNVDKNKPLPGGLPQVCVPVLERCVRDRHKDVMPDQLTVNHTLLDHIGAAELCSHKVEDNEGYPPHVDTHSAFEDLILSLSLGAMAEFVHHVYEEIAGHFSITRHSRWPRVCHFLSSLEPGSILADVGCGNGKYLGVNPEVGCDRSSALVQTCPERGIHAFVSDALSVPLRSDACDACISIAVIHHLSTQRQAVVEELVLLLRHGGWALIYMNTTSRSPNTSETRHQHPTGDSTDHNNQESKSLATDARNTARDLSGIATDCTKVHPETESSAKLSVHTNRTAFNTQDLLVSCHLKGGGGGGSQASAPNTAPSPSPTPSPALSPVFHSFYHLFQKGELEELFVWRQINKHYQDFSK
ncbi:unnamed protein product, partial [Coregonus sp. 'balchen']